MKNLVDSCGWIEYFFDGPNAGFFAKPLEDEHNLIVPTICIVEVFKFILRHKDENSALIAIASMHQSEVINLDTSIAMNAAIIGAETGLPLADSIILATARSNDAVVWTQDIHFKAISGVRYVERRGG